MDKDELLKQIEAIIEEYGCNPEDYNLAAVAKEIFTKMMTYIITRI